MPNDVEIAGQLEDLWKMISDGITLANKVLEQAKEVELDVSAAEKAKAEIAEVIEVEISRAISEVQPEISRVETAKAEIAEVITRANNVIKQVKAVNIRVETAKAEIAEVIEVKISRAISEVQLEISRAETVKSEIAEVMEVEIPRAKSEVQLEVSRAETARSEVQLEVSRAETVKAEIVEVIEVEIPRAKSEAQTQLEEIRQLTKQNESTYNESLQEKLELNERYTSFESLIKEIGGSAGLKELRREIQEGREVAFKLERYHHQENQKRLLKKMEQDQQQLIRQGKLAIVIVSVWVLLISLIK